MPEFTERFPGVTGEHVNDVLAFLLYSLEQPQRREPAADGRKRKRKLPAKVSDLLRFINQGRNRAARVRPLVRDRGLPWHRAVHHPFRRYASPMARIIAFSVTPARTGSTTASAGRSAWGESRSSQPNAGGADEALAHPLTGPPPNLEPK